MTKHGGQMTNQLSRRFAKLALAGVGVLTVILMATTETGCGKKDTAIQHKIKENEVRIAVLTDQIRVLIEFTKKVVKQPLPEPEVTDTPWELYKKAFEAALKGVEAQAAVDECKKRIEPLYRERLVLIQENQKLKQ